MQAQVPAAMLDSQEAFTGVTIKGGDLETGGDATFQPLAATCHDRIELCWRYRRTLLYTKSWSGK